MEEQQIDAFRKALLTLKRELTQLAQDSKASSDTVILDQSSVGRLSRVDALQGQQMAQEVAQRRQSQLVQINGALQRLETGDYGYCFKCGDDIETARLNFNPASTRCMACMED